MTTPFVVTGYEHGVATPVNLGGGIADSVVAGSSMSIQNTVKNTGNYALRVNTSSLTANLVYLAGLATVVSGRVYFRIASAPSGNTVFVRCLTTTGADFGVKYRVADNLMCARVIGVEDGPAYGTAINTNQWYRLDFRFDVSANPNTIDFQIDGTSVTQHTYAQAPDTITSISIGNTDAVTMDVYFDDLVLIASGTDYPIGPGGTELLVPTADGTHVAGTNDIEDQAGNDINGTSVTAYDKINSVPPSSTTYLRQVQSITTHYAEVLFGNITAPHSSIIGAQGFLAYTASTTTLCTAATIISKDDFSSSSAIWGAPGATADYSDGSLAAFYYRRAIIDGVVDDTTVNALKGRFGFSDDATPDPYLIDLLVEVGYKIDSGTDISLDLVGYTSIIPDITILENVVVPLDLVTYSSIVNSLTFLENEIVPLDLVTYSSTVQPLTILENDVVPLDLVTYSSTFNELTVLENVVVPLDLVTFSSTVRDVEVLEEGMISLDLVTFTSTIHNLTVLENEIVPLDLVTYSSVFHDVELMEVGGDLLLDLVSYSSVFPNAFLIAVGANVVVPVERILVVDFQDRVYSITRQNRRLSVDGQDRTF